MIIVERRQPIERRICAATGSRVEELAAQARIQQIARIDDVEWAVLETSGQISFIQKSAPRLARAALPDRGRGRRAPDAGATRSTPSRRASCGWRAARSRTGRGHGCALEDGALRGHVGGRRRARPRRAQVVRLAPRRHAVRRRASSTSTRGELAAVIEADKLGQLRTGAASGVARQVPRARGRDDARRASAAAGRPRRQVACIREAVPTIERVVAYCRSEERLEAFCEKVGAEAGETHRDAGEQDVVVTVDDLEGPRPARRVAPAGRARLRGRRERPDAARARQRRARARDLRLLRLDRAGEARVGRPDRARRRRASSTGSRCTSSRRSSPGEVRGRQSRRRHRRLQVERARGLGRGDRRRRARARARAGSRYASSRPTSSSSRADSIVSCPRARTTSGRSSSRCTLLRRRAVA